MNMSSILTQDNIIRLVIPYAGKMFYSSVKKKDKALCFLIDKGYLESNSLETIYYMVEKVKDDKLGHIVPVGKIEKIHTGGNVFCYRQRVFFKSVVSICSFCKSNGIVVQLYKDFSITINNVLNCLDSLKYLEVYAKTFNMTIDAFLTDACKLQLYLLFEDMGVRTCLGKEVKQILKGKIGFLERAPYLAESYNTDSHTSTIYVPTNVKDERFYRSTTISNGKLCGFLSSVIDLDKKAGVFMNES